MQKYMELSDVTFYYGTKKKQNLILEDVSCRFEEGESYAIIGKSGIGKSTTIALLGGMEKPKKGVVSLGGTDIWKMNGNEYQRKHMGVVFQNYNLLEYLTVYDNIKIAMDIKGMPKEKQDPKIRWLLSRVGLDEAMKDRKVNTLSGGEQQRVAIARAISAEADILLADEPTGNLDEDTTEGIMELLLSLAREEGKCVIIVTHSRYVASCVDHVIRLEDRKLMFV